MKAETLNIKFTKMTGAGNDFILIDNRSEIYSIDWIKVAPKICNRRYGVGADGLIIIEKSDKADFKMNYYNPDGSYGGMCGNGGRCSAIYAMSSLNLDRIKFETLDYIYTAERESAFDIKLNMKTPISINLNILINIFDEIVSVHFIDTGSPHTILFLDSLPDSIKDMIRINGINRVGEAVRYHNQFSPAGTNVDIVEVINDETISMRTYERGVEDETLACGTGAVASAIILSILKNLKNKISVHTRSKEILVVQFEKKGKEISNVELTGSARKVFEGSYQTVI